MTQEQAIERVARGAAFLDKKRPGWAARIDVGTLTLHDSCGCIVGQLCGTRRMSDGCALLGITTKQAIEMGVNATGDDDWWSDETRNIQKFYAPLQNAWIEAIADRLLPVTAEREQVAALKGGK